MQERGSSRASARLATVVLLSGLLVLGVAGGVLASDQFSDVGANHQFHDEISWMADEDISDGYQDGTFRPGSPVTRQAMAAFMQRLAGADPSVAPTVDAETLQGLTPSQLQGQDGQPGVIARTELTYDQFSSVTPPTTGFARLRDIGTVTKQEDGTALRLTAQGHISSTNSYCNVQLRIDDLNRKGGTDLEGTEAIAQGDDESYFIETYFDGLPAGDHDVSMWIRGDDSAACEDNLGNYTRTVMVEEVPAP